MGSISRHIMPLVINSLGGGHTYTNTHTDVRTGTISRNQACAWCLKIIVLQIEPIARLMDLIPYWFAPLILFFFRTRLICFRTTYRLQMALGV